MPHFFCEQIFNIYTQTKMSTISFEGLVNTWMTLRWIRAIS